MLKESGLNKTLLDRWTKLLELKKEKARGQYSFLADWYSWLDALPNDKDLSADETRLAEVKALGEALQAAVESRLDDRQELFAEFGVNAAFVPAEDLSAVTGGRNSFGELV